MKPVPGASRKVGRYPVACSASSKLRAKSPVTKLSKGRLNSEWFTGAGDGTWTNTSHGLSCLVPESGQYEITSALWVFLSVFPLQYPQYWKSSQNGCQGAVLLKHGSHIILKSWKRSSLSWSLLANQVQLVCLYFCPVLCNCDPWVCLGVKGRRRREKQLLSTGTKQQELKADSLCLLDDIKAL